MGTPNSSNCASGISNCRGLLIVHDARGADAPKRRLAGIVLAGRELALLELRHVAFAADGAPGGDARVILGDDAEALYEGVAEIVGRHQLVSTNDVAVRLLELCVAFRRQRIARSGRR